MAANLERLAEEFRQRGFGEFGDALKAQAEVARKLGTPEHFDDASELNIDTEWQRQSQRLVELGFHDELGMNEQDYLESLPKFEPQPEEYKGKFELPLLVETRIPWVKQAELAGITVSDYLKSRTDEIRPYNDKAKTPDGPYTGWFSNWDQRFTDKIRPSDARKQLKKDECGAGLPEGIALQIAHPDFTQIGKYFDLIGFSVGSVNVPYLGRWDDEPRLDADWYDNAYGSFRPLVRGSKIVTG